MGFTSFLSMKPQEIQDDLSSFKAQAYGSTIESLPPVLGKSFTHSVLTSHLNCFVSNIYFVHLQAPIPFPAMV